MKYKIEVTEKQMRVLEACCNTKHISSVYKSLVYGGETTVTFVGDSGDYIHVSESVDEVMRMIKLAESAPYVSMEV